jgi:hypothetical protein
VKSANDRSDIWRDVDPEEVHGPRRFFTGAGGSPNTSSNPSPRLPAR